MIRVLFGADKYVAGWVAGRIPHVRTAECFGDCMAIGFVENGKALGGAVFSRYLPEDGDIEIAVAADDKRAISRWALGVVFAYPFLDLGCVRVTARCAKWNRKARALALRIGFKEEGCKRKALGGQTDLVLYGMLKHECKWLRNKEDGSTRYANAA